MLSSESSQFDVKKRPGILLLPREAETKRCWLLSLWWWRRLRRVCRNNSSSRCLSRINLILIFLPSPASHFTEAQVACKTRFIDSRIFCTLWKSFSVSNLICSKLRGRLNYEKVKALAFIAVHSNDDSNSQLPDLDWAETPQMCVNNWFLSINDYLAAREADNFYLCMCNNYIISQ